LVEVVVPGVCDGARPVVAGADPGWATCPLVLHPTATMSTAPIVIRFIEPPCSHVTYAAERREVPEGYVQRRMASTVVSGVVLKQNRIPGAVVTSTLISRSNRRVCSGAVYSAEPGSPEATALDLLRVTGLQHF
jgi:hypothetical protein